MSMRGATVDEHDARTVSLAPPEVVDGASVDDDLGFRPWRAERVLEPLGGVH
jgi:hypothetical protein